MRGKRRLTSQHTIDTFLPVVVPWPFWNSQLLLPLLAKGGTVDTEDSWPVPLTERTDVEG